MKSDVRCQLQFAEPDGSLKAIQITFTTIDTRGEPILGYDIIGDTTVTNRIFAPRDVYRATKDFLDAAHELERPAA